MSSALSPSPLHYVGPWRAIVVGGGHAGCEAALALARGGVATLLLTQNVDRIGWMTAESDVWTIPEHLCSISHTRLVPPRRHRGRVRSAG